MSTKLGLMHAAYGKYVIRYPWTDHIQPSRFWRVCIAICGNIFLWHEEMVFSLSRLSSHGRGQHSGACVSISVETPRW